MNNSQTFFKNHWIRVICLFVIIVSCILGVLLFLPSPIQKKEEKKITYQSDLKKARLNCWFHRGTYQVCDREFKVVNNPNDPEDLGYVEEGPCQVVCNLP
jgi:hypothetical protein